MNLKKHEKSITKKGLEGLLWNFSGSFIQILVQFIVIGILARLLSPEEFGVVGVILIFVNFTNLFTDLGIATAIVQLKNISKDHISSGYTISLLIGIIVGLLFYGLAPNIAGFFNLHGADNAIRFFAIFFPLRSFNSITLAILRRNFQFSIIVKCGIISYVLGTGLTSIILAYLNFGYWALILGQLAGILVTIVTMIYYQPPIFSFRFNKKIVSELLFFGMGHTMGTIFNYFAENGDNIIIGKSLGTVSLGIYSKAFQLFSIPASFFGGIFDKVLFPILSQKQEEKEKLKHFYLFSSSLCFGILFPMATLLFINAELIVKILLGDQWLEVIYLFQVLIFGLAYRFGTRINKSYLKSLGIIYKGAYYQLVFVFLIFTFCTIGQYLYGLPGVAYGVFIATFINYLQMSYRIYKELNFSKEIFIKIHIKTLVFYAPFFALTILLNFFGINSIWVHFFLSLFLYLPIITLIVLHKKNVIFNDDNSLMISQVLKFIPNILQKRIKKIKKFKKYF